MTQLMVYHLAARTDAGVAGRHESYMAKIAGTELGFRVADRCLQIHGGMGLATEMPISQMWRDARSFMITEGPVEVMRMVLAAKSFAVRSKLARCGHGRRRWRNRSSITNGSWPTGRATSA